MAASMSPEDAAQRLNTFLADCLGSAPKGLQLPVDLQNPIALSSCLMCIKEAITSARVDVMDVVDTHKPEVDCLLLTAEELHMHLSGLQRHSRALSRYGVQAQLESGLLRLPSLRADLEGKRIALGLLDAFAELHRRLILFDDAVGSRDLQGASQHLRSLRAEVEFGAAQMKVLKKVGVCAHAKLCGQAHTLLLCLVAVCGDWEADRESIKARALTTVLCPRP